MKIDLPIVNSEKEKYEKVHSDSDYGCGPRQVKDLEELTFPFSKRFKEIIEENNDCLDIACGGGTVMNYVNQLGCTPTGVDISENAIRKVSKDFNTFVASAHELPFEDDSFDITYFLDGMEHVPEEIENQSIKESFRVAKNYVCHAIALCSSCRNGVELHCNLKPYDKWKEIFDNVAVDSDFELDLEHYRNDTIHLIYKKI